MKPNRMNNKTMLMQMAKAPIHDDIVKHIEMTINNIPLTSAVSSALFIRSIGINMPIS